MPLRGEPAGPASCTKPQTRQFFTDSTRLGGNCGAEDERGMGADGRGAGPGLRGWRESNPRAHSPRTVGWGGCPSRPAALSGAKRVQPLLSCGPPRVLVEDIWTLLPPSLASPINSSQRCSFTAFAHQISEHLTASDCFTRELIGATRSSRAAVAGQSN